MEKYFKKGVIIPLTLLFIFGSFLPIFNFFSDIVYAAISITSPATATLTGKTVSTSSQASTGAIVAVEVIDDGTAGWTATMTSTNFTIRKNVVTLSGSNSDVSSSGTYDGVLGVQADYPSFVVKITTGGLGDGTAKYSYWKAGTDPSGAADGTNVATSGGATLLSNGVYIAFTDTTTYVVDDKWSILVDVFPYTGLTVIPGTITVVSGDTGVNAGSSGALTGSGVTSDAKTIMTGDVGDSTGTYQQDEDLSLTIHANSLQGQFQATATLTVS